MNAVNGLLNELRIKLIQIGKKYEKINSESELMQRSDYCPEEMMGMLGEDLKDVAVLIGQYLGEKDEE